MPPLEVSGASVAGATFAVIGVLLLLEALDVFALSAAVIPAVLLIGLGLALLARR